MPNLDARVDEQIAESPAFAQPVMRHLRELVHRGAPEVVETIKWGRPFFLCGGKLLCYMAAFTKHCGFGFVGPEMRSVMLEAGMPVEDASGSLGKITSFEDLPPDSQMLAWIRQAVVLAEGGRPKRKRAAPRPEIEAPPELLAALRKSIGAMKTFADFSPSCRREYAEWISEAKRPETRQRRVAQAVEWIAQGKTRHWKYKPAGDGGYAAGRNPEMGR